MLILQWMKNYRRLMTWVFIFAAFFMLAGCSKNETKKNVSSEAAMTPENYKSNIPDKPEKTAAVKSKMPPHLSDDLAAIVDRADASVDADQLDDAMKDYDKAEKLVKDCYRVHYGRGRVYFKRGHNNKAHKEFERALEIKPDYDSAYFQLGRIYHKQKEYEKAIGYYQKALKINPDNADLNNNLGFACFYLNRYDEAMKYFNRSIDIDPTKAYPYFGRARIFVELEQEDKALKDFDQAVKLDKKFGEAWLQRGILYAGTMKYPEAVRDLSIAVELRPGDKSSLLERGIIYFWMGEFEKAEDDFSVMQVQHVKTSVKNGTGDVTGQIHILIGLSKYKTGNLEEGKEQIRKGISMVNTTHFEDEEWDMIGYGYLALEDYDNAFKCFDSYREGDLDHALYGRACCYLHKGEKEKAIKDLEEAIKVLPETWVRRESAKLLKKLKDGKVTTLSLPFYDDLYPTTRG